MSELHRVFLLPGFFGFTHLGEIVYFGHVRDLLLAELGRQRVPVEVHPLLTPPTASILTRARAALEAIGRAAGEAGPIHLVGHSTGGLDARLIVSPGSELHAAAPPGLMERVRSVVTVSTPHRGSPLAAFFLGLAGQQSLKLLSVFTAAALRRRALPLGLIFRLTGALLRADDWFNSKRTLLDQLFSDLLFDFSAERRSVLADFFSSVARDQALMTQLTPEAMELFHATTRDNPAVRYGSVVTCAARPTLKSRWASGLDAYAQLSHTLFEVLYRRAGRAKQRRYEVSLEHQQALRQGFGAVPAPDESDGIVPTLSQPHGTLIATARADHLDAIGHFDAPNATPPHYDWLTSGSGFDATGFQRVWREVAAYLIAR